MHLDKAMVPPWKVGFGNSPCVAETGIAWQGDNLGRRRNLTFGDGKWKIGVRRAPNSELDPQNAALLVCPPVNLSARLPNVVCVIVVE
jgi:hypothetical protein